MSIELGFKADVKITDFIKENGFTLSAEIIPPRNGTEQSRVLDQVSRLISAGAQFLSVTKGAGGSLRGGSLPIAHVIKEQVKVPCIAHFTCRDLTAQEVENQLIDHSYFGIRNILALRGDPPRGQTEWTVKEGAYLYAHQLIEQISKLNQGEYLTRKAGPQVAGKATRTDFCIGAAAYPEHPDLEERLRFFKLKAEAGAEYGITQMVFDPEKYGAFLDLCEKGGVSIPILPGTRVLKSKKQALRMQSLFGVGVSKKVLDRLPEEDSPDEQNLVLDVFDEMSETLKRYGAPGVHLFVINDTEISSLALRRLQSMQKKKALRRKSLGAYELMTQL